MVFFNFNGKLLPAATPVIGPDNRGLRYGDGLFETFKYFKGLPVLFDEHLARLWNGLNLLKFDIPKFFSPDKLQEEVTILLKKNNYADARVRLSVFRGDGGLYDHKNAMQYIIQCWPLDPSAGRLNENGLELGIFRDAKKSIDAFSNCKHNNFLPYLMGALFAKESKLNDAIILNQHDRICDTTIANIFIVKDDLLISPPLAEGCIAGIMRKTIIQALSETQFSVQEQAITEEALLTADEVFLTNSIANMRWVKAIHNKAYASKKTLAVHGFLTQTIPTVFC